LKGADYGRFFLLALTHGWKSGLFRGVHFELFT
jgi:hypothetical protein